MASLYNRVSPKVGQVTKQGGERYEAKNVGAADLKAGDPVELVSGTDGIIGVQKWAAGVCIGFVISETIDKLIKQNDYLTYGGQGTFMALNAVAAVAINTYVKPHANGMTLATLPADAALVVGKTYGPAGIGEIAIIKLLVE